MTGPAPKQPEDRVRRHRPARGEWVTLPAEPFTGSKPRMPRGLLESSKGTWRRWWRSPMAHMWVEAQWDQVERLVLLVDRARRQLSAGEKTPDLGELRQLEDRLGISEKGRRDLRWRFAEDEEPVLASVTPLSRARPDPRKKAK